MKMRALALIVLSALFAMSAQSATLLWTNATWRYLKGTQEASTPISAWRTNGFDDSSWLVGDGAFWYDTDTNPQTAYSGSTQLPDMNGGYSCIFLRRTFVVTNVNNITSMTLAALCDDGYVAWINGTPVVQYNMPTNDPAYNSTSLAALGEPLPIVYNTITTPGLVLVEGTNTIAIQAFNSSLSGSSDFVISAALLMGAPTISSISPAPGNVNGLTQITVTFDEPVTGVDASDLLVNGQACTAVSGGGSSYVFTPPTILNGTAQVTWVANHGIRDNASPANNFDSTAAGASWSYNIIDTVAPTIAARFPSAGASVATLGSIQVNFSEPVQGVDASDLIVNGTNATNVIIGSPSIYTFQFASQPTGNVTVAFAPNHGIYDLANPSNAFAGGTWNYTVSRMFIAVRINEFLAANSGSGTNAIKDEDGDSSDWIELYNPDTSVVDLGGWSMSDDQTKPTKWRFPNGATVPARGYLVVFASGKNKTNAVGRLHTSFKLSSSASYLALYNPLTNVMSQFNPYPAQSTDVSYGCDRLDPTILGFFTVPTPGADNATRGAGFGPEVTFSRPGGTFVGSFSLSLTSAPGSVIRYVVVSTANTTNTPIPVDIPGTNSTLYTGPITVNNTVEVRARAFPTNTSFFPGPPHTECYLSVATAITNFVSTLPVVVIHTVGAASLSQGYPAYDNSVMIATFDTNIFSGGRLISSLNAQPGVIKRAGINLRGSSTQGFPKSSYAIEFWDDYNNDEETKMFDLPGESDWVLYGINAFDTSLMHNPLFQEWGLQMGLYGARYKFVEVFFHNGTGALTGTTNSTGTGMGDYAGVYVLEEKIKRDNNRLSIDKLEPQHTNYPAITGGYLVKIDRADGNERTFTPNGVGGAVVYQDPDGLEMVTPARAAQSNYLMSYFNFFNTALTGANLTNATGTNHYSNYIDIDKSIDHHIDMVLTLNADAYRLSGYIYKPREGKLTFGPLWDCDRGQGTSKSDGRAFNPRCWQASNPSGAGGTDYGSDFFQGTTIPTWMNRLFADLDFWQRWIDRYQEWRTSVLDTNHVAAVIDGLANTVREAQPRESKRWGGNGSSDTNPRSGAVTSFNSDYSYTFPGTYQGEVDFQKKWYFDRIQFFDTNFLGRPNWALTQGMVAAGTVLTISDTSGKAGTAIYYTLDGSDPRGSWGKTNPAARLYTGPITITNNVRIRARAVNASHSNQTGTLPNAAGSHNPIVSSTWSGDKVATYYVSIPTLAITEIMFNPSSLAGNTNDSDAFEYIELKNVGTNTINLVGFRFTNGVDFTFTTNSGVTSLAPGAYCLIVKSISAFTNRYGNLPNIAGEYGGQLDNSGERLTLVGAALEPVLDFTYNDSWLKLADGSGFSLVLSSDITAGTNYSNSASWQQSNIEGGSPGVADPGPRQLPRIVISEALTHTDLPQVDTIELQNLESTNVDVSGWFLSDNFDKPKKYIIPAGTIIPAGGFVTFDESQFNVGSNAFSLSSEGDDVWLFSGNTNLLTGYYHGYDFGPAQNGVSFGRYVRSDGNEDFVALATNSLGFSNGLPRVGPIVISEIHYHPPDTGSITNLADNALDEFVELHNITGSSVMLFDTNHPTNTWRLSKAADFVFPTNMTIPADGYLLVLNFDPADTNLLAAFKSKFGVPAGVQFVGPYGGKLDNDDDVVKLSRPDEPNPLTGYVPYIQVDRIHYHDSAPWTGAADGFGPSLQRIVQGAYGNDPTNWAAALPTAGAGFVPGNAPVITQQPQGGNFIENNTVTLSVSVSGVGPFGFQWRYVAAGASNATTVPGATNITLVISNAQTYHSGAYAVAVFSAGGAVMSDSATVTVRSLPKFLVQPVNATNNPGASVTLSVVATGTGSLSYQWRKDSNILAGATATNIVITNLDLFTHAGFYDVLVTDSVGTVASTPAVVNVFTRPVVVVPPFSQTVLAGQPATYSVVAGPVHPLLPLTYRWSTTSGTPGNNTNSTLVLTNWPSTQVRLNIQTPGTPSNFQTNVTTNIFGTILLTVLADNDRDGIADTWELANGFSTNNAADALLDTDGDGVINRDEYIAGTNPRDASSYLKFNSAIFAGTNGTLTFTAVSNRVYQIEMRDEFAPTNLWTSIANISAVSSNRTITITNAVPGSARYYRIQIPPTSPPSP